MKNVYRLNRCQLDSKNIVINEQYVGMFSTPERVLAYLTHNGKSHGQLSVLGFSDADQEYILWLIGYIGATLVVHHDAEDYPLLGVSWPETNDYYTVRKYEVDSLMINRH